MTVGERLIAACHGATILRIVLTADPLRAGLDSKDVLAAVVPQAEDLLEELYWIQCALRNAGALDVPAPGEEAPPAAASPVAVLRQSGPAPLVDVEREHIIRALEQAAGNKAVAAQLLGIDRRALYRRLERHGLHQRVPTPPAKLQMRREILAAERRAR